MGNEELLRKWALRGALRLKKEKEERERREREEEERKKREEEERKKREEEERRARGEEVGEDSNSGEIVVPEAGEYMFLEGEFGKSVLEEYNRRVKLDYDDNAKLKVLNWDKKKKVVSGSNSFAPILIDKIVRERDCRVVLPSQMEKSLVDGDGLGIKGNYYVDLGIVLRSRGEPNSYLAEKLADEVERRGYKLDVPLFVSFRGLELEKDGGSSYGLRYGLADESLILEAPVLVGSNSGESFVRGDANGFPVLDENGNRSVYTRDSGVCRLCLDRGLYLNSSGEGLAGSFADGRVVLCREAARSRDSGNSGDIVGQRGGRS